MFCEKKNSLKTSRPSTFLVTRCEQTSSQISCTSWVAFFASLSGPQAISKTDQSRGVSRSQMLILERVDPQLRLTLRMRVTWRSLSFILLHSIPGSLFFSSHVRDRTWDRGWGEEGRLLRNMADGKEAKVRWKKSEKHRRTRRRESWAREEKEIKELEDRCRDVSCR